MSARLPADLLRRSAEEGARLVVLTYLDEVGRAQRRLADPQDLEALHDFRVGLRRLRSCIRSYRGPLRGSVSNKMRRRLRALTLATNGWRDTEVQLAWLRRQAGHLVPGETEGLAWLLGRLEGRQYDAREKVTSKVAGRWVKAANKLRPRLETIRLVVQTGRKQQRCSFAQTTGELVGSHAERLAEALQPLRSAEERDQAHAARIAAKRLRYLLEPLSRRVPRAKALVGRLKQLQDLLGELHDVQVMGEEIASSLEALSKVHPPSSAVPGLLALQRLGREYATQSFASFASHWAGERGLGFLSRVEELGRGLRRGESTEPATLAAQHPGVVNNGSAGRHRRSPAMSAV